jgi:hypothetical protein
MRTSLFWIGAACVAMTVASLATAQGTAQKAPYYNVKDEVVVRGKVVEAKVVPDWMGKDSLNLVLENEQAREPHVDVAPAAFLQLLDFPVAVGDELELTGYWGKAADGTPVFLVHQLKKNRVTLNVRDPQGMPLW